MNSAVICRLILPFLFLATPDAHAIYRHITAGNNAQVTGSDIAAAKDINLRAENVTLDNGLDRYTAKQSHDFSQSGLTLSVTSPVISSLQAVQQMQQAKSQTKDGRAQALATLNQAVSLKNAYDAVQAGQTVKNGNAADKMGGINVSVSFGSSSSHSESTQTSTQAVGSTVSAGNNINIVATSGAADNASESTERHRREGNLNVIGSAIRAGNDTSLNAANAIQLLAAQNTASQTSSNSSSSSSIGVSFGLGAGGAGLSLNIAASQARGNADGNDVGYTNSHVSAGNQLSLNSGADTTLMGAVASGKQVVANVGGNLNLTSLQDTSSYNSQQSSSGFSLSIPIGAGSSFGASISGGGSKIDSNYASVTEQSGIKAGDNGYQVNVNGDTSLTGAVIASSDQAIQNGKNRFSTGGTLAMNDIRNSASYQADASSFSAGVGSMLGASGGIGSDSGNASSTTKSGIGVSTNTDTTGALGKIFDASAVTADVNAQVLITQTFSQMAPKAVGDYANSKLMEAQKLSTQADTETDPAKKAELMQQAQSIVDNWKEGGTARVALHTIVGALGGGVEGALGAGVSAATVPLIAAQIDKLDVPVEVKQSLILAAGAAVGGAAGGTAGAATGVAQTGNNYLSHQENTTRLMAAINCAAGDQKSCQVRDALNAKDQERDAVLKQACQSDPKSAGCVSATLDMRNQLATYFQPIYDVQPAPDSITASEQQAGVGAYTAQSELQSYVDLLKVSNQQMRDVQNPSVSQMPTNYNSDPYGVMNAFDPALYMVVKVGDKWGVVGKSDNVYTDVGGLNGIKNPTNYAPGLIGRHVEYNFPSSSLYTLYYNPTNGFIRDGIETFMDKFGFTTPVAQQFSQVLTGVQSQGKNVSWVVHSQGGAIFTQAALASGSTDLSKNSVAFHAGANNKLVTNYILNNANINKGQTTQYLNNPNDIVPNVIGLNGSKSQMLQSLVSWPLLFMGPELSPHTLPPSPTSVGAP